MSSCTLVIVKLMLKKHCHDYKERIIEIHLLIRMLYMSDLLYFVLLKLGNKMFM